jgi:hypothetical protein
LRFLRCLLSFLAGLLAVAAVLYPLLPGDDLTAFDEPFRLAPECELLFVGPSYIKYGVVTEAFEEESKRLGHPLRICKYAREALRGYEVRHDLELLMKHPFPRLKAVVIDVTLSPRNLGFMPENWFTQRVVRWHTWRALPWLGRHYQESGQPWREDAPQILAHAQHVAMNYLGNGRGGTLLTQARALDTLFGARARGRKKGPATPTFERPRSKTAANTREYQKLRDELAAKKSGQRKRPGSGDERWPRELEAIVREAGHEPIFLYSPVLAHKPVPRLERRGERPLVFLDFEDPDQFPELYEFGVRAKGSHLTVRGSVLFSRRLAAAVSRLEERR